MAITLENTLVLTAPFAARDHEFNRGFIYISEEAICQRIEAVDPSWEWRVEDMIFENDMATVIGVLTICGVKRYGTGQQLAQIDKNGKESVGESRKGATTDAMKRAARLFGIGRYLLQCPKTVKDHGKDLEAWLKSLSQGQAASQTPVSRPAQPSTSAPMQTPASASPDAKSTPATNADWLKEERFIKWAWDTFRLPGEALPYAIAKTKKPAISLTKDEAKGAVLSLHCDYDAEKVATVAAEKELSIEVVTFANTLSL